MNPVFARKFAFVLLALVFASATVLQAANAGWHCEEETVLTVATPFKSGHILTDAAEKFKELIEKDSKGKIKVEIQAGIDSEEDVNTKASEGVVDIQFNGGRPLEVFSPEYFFFNAPYVIRDYEHFQRVWEGDLGDEAKEEIEDNGNMLSLGTVYRGLRQTTSNEPLTDPEDFAGLKLRLPVVPTWITSWESLGVEAVPVTLPELYQALADGRAEASEGDLPQIDSFKLYEVQSHLNITNHLVAVGWVFINEDSYDDLTKKEQKMVKKAIKKATKWATQKTEDSESDLLQKLEDAGMTIVHPDADAIREQVKPTIESMFETEWPVTTWEEVLDY